MFDISCSSLMVWSPSFPSYSVQGPDDAHSARAPDLPHVGGDRAAGGRGQSGHQEGRIPPFPHVPLRGCVQSAVQWWGLQDLAGPHQVAHHFGWNLFACTLIKIHAIISSLSWNGAFQYILCNQKQGTDIVIMTVILWTLIWNFATVSDQESARFFLSILSSLVITIMTTLSRLSNHLGVPFRKKAYFVCIINDCF